MSTQKDAGSTASGTRFDVGVQQIEYVDSTCGPARDDKVPAGPFFFDQAGETTIKVSNNYMFTKNHEML